MAKSAKEKVAAKLAVDGTPKLAAKSKASDKHEKANLTIEEATVASPRPSRKRTGEYFDFDPDTVADEDADAEAKVATKNGASKVDKPSKKAETSADSTVKKRGKKAKTGEDGETLEDSNVAENAKKPKSKKAEGAEKDVVVGSPGDTAAVPTEKGTSAKKGKSKQGDSAAPDATGEKRTTTKTTGPVKDAGDVKKAKGMKGEIAKKDTATTDGETIGERVAAEDAKKPKSKKSDAPKHEDFLGPSGDTAEVSAENKPKKGKAAKDKAAASKESEKEVKKRAAKEKPEGSKASKKADKDAVADPSSAKTKDAEKKAAPKPKANKGKDAKEIILNEPKATAKKAKGKASKDTPTATTDAAMDQGPFENLLDTTEKGKTHVPVDSKTPKASKAKKDVKKPAKVTAADKPAKKVKDGDAAKPKKTTKAKGNKADIPDQAIQPMDLVEEEAALNAPSKPETSASASKGKKRKTTSDRAAESVKSKLLDPLSDHAAEESANKKQKTSRKSIGESLGAMVATGKDAVLHSLGGLLGGGSDGKPIITGSSNKSKGKGKATDTDQLPANEAPKEAAGAVEDQEDEDYEEGEPDDQTAALLAGFESDGDDVHPPGDAGFKEGAKIPNLPNSKATNQKLKAIKPAEKDVPGVVYVGRIPHGFYEHEMRAYFSQFGDIDRLRLSRSKKTGHSKHYAFLEFKSEDVAKIVAETMDNYLMFGHILKCKVVSAGDIHESMWKGADKRFKKVPWNKIEGRKLEVPVRREVWKKREEKETVKRAEKGKKMLETVGYAFEGTGLKSVESVPEKIGKAMRLEEEKSLVTAGGEEASRPVVVNESVTTTTVKKGGKVVAGKATATVTKTAKRALEGGEEVIASATKKAKKAKKTSTA